MRVRNLQKDDLEHVLELFYTCFSKDHYYLQMFGGAKELKEQARDAFRESIAFCIDSGLSTGVTGDSGELIAFALLFDYHETRKNHPSTFNGIFGVQAGQPLPYSEELHGAIASLSGDVLYLLSIAVAPEYQMRGLASCLIDDILDNWKNCHLVSDVSNGQSLAMYRKRGFHVNEIDDNYFYVAHLKDAPTATVDFSEEIALLVPDPGVLDRYGVPYQVKKNRTYLMGCRVQESYGISSFAEEPGALCEGTLVSLRYSALLDYQRTINLCQFDEKMRGGMVYYVQRQEYICPPLLNQTLEEMLKTRQAEWSIIPDVYVSIPLQYLDKGKLLAQTDDAAAEALLRDMDFRTHFEAGVPSNVDRVDDQASFKRRIERHYLGKLRLQISSEITVDHYAGLGDVIGPAAMADLYISLDRDSNCAVLTVFSLSSPFLISHLFDNVIRNQLIVADGGRSLNFYDYLKDRFELVKRGTPKIFSVLPCRKDRLSESQLASLLAAETIYPEGENFGKITDPDILSRVAGETGMGQYDRAFVCAYSNVVLQFSEEIVGSVRDRLCEESITLFYIELILFEEAAIHIADREIVSLFTSGEVDDPVQFLSKVDKIYDNYSKTIDFWDINVNYPTSQKSIVMLRDSFGLHEQLEKMKRNQEQLQTVFGTKCDIIDRKDSKRMDTSLAIISVFAIFSAWLDSYDYTATWADILSAEVIRTLQIIFFILISITAGYAVTHLFGNRISLILRRRRAKLRKKRTFGRSPSSYHRRK